MYDEYETCIKLQRKPKKPVVNFALRKVFNEVIGMDVGELEREKLMVMIRLGHSLL